jgi:hypothetical protein
VTKHEEGRMNKYNMIQKKRRKNWIEKDVINPPKMIYSTRYGNLVFSCITPVRCRFTTPFTLSINVCWDDKDNKWEAPDTSGVIPTID